MYFLPQAAWGKVAIGAVAVVGARPDRHKDTLRVTAADAVPRRARASRRLVGAPVAPSGAYLSVSGGIAGTRYDVSVGAGAFQVKVTNR